MRHCVSIILLSLISLSFGVSAQFDGPECGKQHGGKLCPGQLCCSQFGECGSDYTYCEPGYCQSQCRILSPPPPPPPKININEIFPKYMFEDILLYRNERPCTPRYFYTYDAFIKATKKFPQFASVAIGDEIVRVREIIAFFAQTAYETNGGWPDKPDPYDRDAPNSPYDWGYCFVEQTTGLNKSNYCVPSKQWPCAKGKSYHGRGPFQIKYNYNYGAAGKALSRDLLNHPELVAEDPVVSFETALWVWMTPKPPKPSCHNVISGKWKPSSADINAERFPGFGVTTNIINGKVECGHGWDEREEKRIGFYKAFCSRTNVTDSFDLYCGNQMPFASSSSGLTISLEKI